jgi:hypothetical protein
LSPLFFIEGPDKLAIAPYAEEHDVAERWGLPSTEFDGFAAATFLSPRVVRKS